MPDASPPLVSICVPTHNGARYLRECLESALAQTFGQFELLVVDDASSDTTVAVATDFARSDARVRVHENPQRLGLVGNWNRCVELARGEWLKFLFQDDWLDRHCLTRLLDAPVPGVLLVACRRASWFDSTVRPQLRGDYERYVAEHNLPRRFPGRSIIEAEAFAEHMLDFPLDNCIGEPTATLIHADAFRRYGLFHPHLVQLGDWEHAARVALQNGLCYVDAPLVTFRLHGASTTAVSWSARSYRRDVIDPLLILHEVVYAPTYRSVRDAAARRTPPIELSQRLHEAVDRAHGRARDGRDLAEWRDAVRNYPRLLSGPPTHRLRRWLKRSAPTSLLSLGRRVRKLRPRHPD